MGRIGSVETDDGKTSSEAPVGLSYRSVEWNTKLNGGKGGYQSTKLSGHPWMLSFNGWFTFMPCEAVKQPFQMGKLMCRKNAVNMHGDGTLLNGVAREGAISMDGQLYSTLYNESGEAQKGVTQMYEVSDNYLTIGNVVQNSVVDRDGRRPGKFNWRDHFEPALVEEDDGNGGTRWQVITRNIVISKRFVDECFSHGTENAHDPTAPRYEAFDTAAEKIWDDEEPLKS